MRLPVRYRNLYHSAMDGAAAATKNAPNVSTL